jgi:hypothetical protein
VYVFSGEVQSLDATYIKEAFFVKIFFLCLLVLDSYSKVAANPRPPLTSVFSAAIVNDINRVQVGAIES